MTETIYLLDFRHGTVEEIEEPVPLRGVHDTAEGDAPEKLPEGAGFVLAALGSPPESAEE